MENPYYTLLIKNPSTRLWGIEFGDYDREIVEEERDITWREGYGTTLDHTRIIKTGQSPDEVNAKLNELNRKRIDEFESNKKDNTNDVVEDSVAWENKNFAEYLKSQGHDELSISRIANGWFKDGTDARTEQPKKKIKYSVCVEVVNREFYEVDAVDEDDAIHNWLNGKHYHTNNVCDEPVSATPMALEEEE